MRLTNLHYLFEYNLSVIFNSVPPPHIFLGFVSYPEDGGNGVLRSVYAYLLTRH